MALQWVTTNDDNMTIISAAMCSQFSTHNANQANQFMISVLPAVWSSTHRGHFGIVCQSAWAFVCICPTVLPKQVFNLSWYGGCLWWARHAYVAWGPQVRVQGHGVVYRRMTYISNLTDVLLRFIIFGGLVGLGVYYYA